MTSRSALYRKRLKEENSALYEEYLAKQRKAGKARREKVKEEPVTRGREVKLRARRERHRISQAQYRARKRGDQEMPIQPRTPRANVKAMTPKERRAHGARLRAESRARQSAQKKRRVRERAREYMRQKRSLKSNPLASSPLRDSAQGPAASAPVENPSILRTPPSRHTKKTRYNRKAKIKRGQN